MIKRGEREEEEGKVEVIVHGGDFCLVLQNACVRGNGGPCSDGGGRGGKGGPLQTWIEGE